MTHQKTLDFYSKMQLRPQERLVEAFRFISLGVWLESTSQEDLQETNKAPEN